MLNVQKGMNCKKKNILMSCILKLLETIYSNSAHQGVIGIVNAEKRLLLNITFSGVDGNSGVHRHLEGQG